MRLLPVVIAAVSALTAAAVSLRASARAVSSAPGAAAGLDADEQELEAAIELRDRARRGKLALEQTQALARVSLMIGTATALVALVSTPRDVVSALVSWISGFAGWGACLEARRRIKARWASTAPRRSGASVR